MAISSLSTYQIVLIIILALNFVFWVAVIFWRIMLFDCAVSRRYIASLRTLLHLGPSTDTPENRHNNSHPESGDEAPPPYEEALKFPSISSLLTDPGTTGAGSRDNIISSRSYVGNSSANIYSMRPSGGYDNAAVRTATSNTRMNDSQVEIQVTPGRTRHDASSHRRSFSCGDLESLPKYDSLTPVSGAQ